MRPKRIVLLVDADENRLSVRTFLFEMKGYAVITARSISEAEQACEPYIEGLVSDLEVDGGGGVLLVKRLRVIRPYLPMMLVSERAQPGSFAHDANLFLGKSYLTHTSLIEGVRTMLARKRGPKPVRPVVPQELVG